MTRPGDTLLKVDNISKAFGGFEVLHGVGLTVNKGERVSLIGSNGAGKTTLFNIISRLDRPDAGAIEFDGRNLLAMPPHALVSAGISRTFQHTALFTTLSVEDNIRIPLLSKTGDSILNGCLRFPSFSRRLREDQTRVERALETLDLAGIRDLPVIGLPNPTLKRIEIARAIVTSPRLLMLDEPAGGLTLSEIDELSQMLRRLEADLDVAVLLIEHNMRFVMNLSDYVFVLNHGAMLAAGTPAEVRRNPDVISAYLGGNMALLEVEAVVAGYGSSAVLHGIDFQVERGEFVAVLGANGAGKTTLLKLISGIVHSRGGRIAFDNDDISHCSAAQIVRRGVCHVPEGRHIFPDMTVHENLIVGGYCLRPNEAKRGIGEILERFPILAEMSNRRAGLLSGGQQQILAIARALVARPKLLLLDEPMLGLAPYASEYVGETLKSLNAKDGLTILAVEQNVYTALKLATRGFVIQSGTIALRGSAQELWQNEDVIRAYIGV